MATTSWLKSAMLRTETRVTPIPIPMPIPRMVARVGGGALAEVFVAIDDDASGQAPLRAIKYVRGRYAHEPRVRRVFQEDGRAAADLVHPNIVPVHEVGEVNGRPFVAMEYVEGHAVSDLLDQARKVGMPFGPALSVHIVAEALAALAHAHERAHRMLHREVAPNNLFITYDGRVKLGDFGVGRARLALMPLVRPSRYTAPEQCRGGAGDARSDVYSAGLVLWELVTGHRLAAGEGMVVPRASSVVPGIDRRLDVIIDRAVQYEPERRFDSARDMRAGLRAYLSAARVRVTPLDVANRVGRLFPRGREQIARGTLDMLEDAEPSDAFLLVNPGAVDAPIQDAPVDDAPVDDAPIDDAPVDDEPVDDAPRVRPRPVLPWAMPAAALLGAAVVFLALRFVPSIPRRSAPTGVALETRMATAAAARLAAEREIPTPIPVASVASVETHVAPMVVIVKPTPTPPLPKPLGVPYAPRRTQIASAPRGEQKVESSGAGAGSGAHGYLTLDTVPWTRVSEGGRALGTTPLVREQLGAGSHQLTLENAEEGIKQTYSVTLKNGEHVSRRLGLKSE